MWKIYDKCPRIEVNENGEVRYVENKKKVKFSKYTYLVVTVWNREKKKNEMFNVHRIVAETFIANPNNYNCVNHKNENKYDNRVDNLEWCTYGYNTKYSKKEEINKKTSITLLNNKYSSKPIAQIDINGNVIKKYPSIAQASRDTNICSSLIFRVLHNMQRKTHNTYWRWS